MTTRQRIELYAFLIVTITSLCWAFYGVGPALIGAGAACVPCALTELIP